MKPLPAYGTLTVQINMNSASMGYQNIYVVINDNGIQWQSPRPQGPYEMEVIDRLITYAHMAYIQWLEEMRERYA